MHINFYNTFPSSQKFTEVSSMLTLQRRKDTSFFFLKTILKCVPLYMERFEMLRTWDLRKIRKHQMSVLEEAKRIPPCPELPRKMRAPWVQRWWHTPGPGQLETSVSSPPHFRPDPCPAPFLSPASALPQEWSPSWQGTTLFQLGSPPTLVWGPAA